MYRVKIIPWKEMISKKQRYTLSVEVVSASGMITRDERFILDDVEFAALKESVLAVDGDSDGSV